jgi:agmatine deiminase
MRITKLLPIFLSLISLSGLYSQVDYPGLPKWMTEEEKALLSSYIFSEQHFRNNSTSPPEYPVRTIGEWEEMQAVVITWTSYRPTLTEIVRHAQEEVRVYIVCSDSVAVKNYMAQRGVTDHNVTYVIAPFNTVWVRDYGPNALYANDIDSLVFVDWIYNRPRPNDNRIPGVIGEVMNIPVYATSVAPTDLVNTGGNFMSDGLGTGFSSELVLDENRQGNPFGVSPKSEEDIDEIMYRYMGIERYIKMTNLPFDGIHHIDMHMKLLDEETLLVGEYPEGVADGPQIEANLQYVLSNYTSVFGTPYRVIRIPMPPDPNGRFPDLGGHYRTYTNSVILNKTILVPVYDPQYDTTALRIYREAMPGYKIEGIDCNDIIRAGGAIHCITKEIGVQEPLWMVHKPLRGLQEDAAAYPVQATIKHRSGIDSVWVHVSTRPKEGFAAIPMQVSDTLDFGWEIMLDNHGSGDTLYYFLEALASNGKRMTRPITAPDGYYSYVGGLNTSSRDITVSHSSELKRVYPNPAGAVTVIPVHTDLPQKATIQLINLTGTIVMPVFDGQLPQGDSNHFFHADRLIPGTWFVRMITQDGVQVQKVLVR